MPLNGARVKNPADSLFEEELRRRRIPLVANVDDGVYRIELLGVEHTVSLANLRRNFDRDGDPAVVASFVDGFLATRVELPPWPEASQGIRFSAEPSDYDFQETIHTSVTPELARVLVYTDSDESRVSWLTPSHLERWGVSVTQMESVAAQNLSTLLTSMQLEIDTVAGQSIGMLSAPSIFKAALLFSPGLRAFVAPLGWPILAVAPSRDFVYFFTSRDLIPRLGSVVMREYSGSGYPVTTEVLQVSGAGIEALGAFGGT